ncbi:MAG: type II toxin-antitoxin system HicB family antitoxin [Chloroflexi bacterium]|nr:type II toxin-antitoxin system HicB family antitoxin [Chloroflexota bacterium]
MNVKQFAVTLDSDEDGFYVSSCPALPGCHSQGRTRDEALNNIAQAIRGYLASMRKHGETLPEAHWEVVEVVL